MKGNFEAGKYILTWDASSVPSGMYFIKAQMEEFAITQKILLLK